MEPSSSPSPFRTFKSKKIIPSTSKLASPVETPSSDPNTPEKPMQLRTRPRRLAFSVNEVKKCALGLRKSNPEGSSSTPSDPTMKTKSGSSIDSMGKSPKKKGPSIVLPEKYELLGEFFHCMDHLIRLRRMKGKLSQFSSISRGIEMLTERRITYNHIAQMKYIFPEVIVLEKVLSYDEPTFCMMPDLQISLEPDALDNDNGKRKGGIGLSKVFRIRLANFAKAHPEGDEIPEEALPEPFNRTRQTVVPNMSLNRTSTLPNTSLCSLGAQPLKHLAPASHLRQSFQSRFLKRTSMLESQKTQLLSTPPKPPTSTVEEPCLVEKTLTPIKLSSRLPIIRLSPLSPLVSCDKDMSVNESDCSTLENNCTKQTPAKDVSTPMRMMIITPDLKTPKRSHIDDDFVVSSEKLVKRPVRSLLFNTPVKMKPIIAANIKLLPETLVQSIMEGERKAIEDQEIGISQAKRRKKVVACLPKLFNMIQAIFQSINRCVATKKELMYKIIAGHTDIMDRSEVEEQLMLLLELVPDWIWEKVASSGDTLVCINKKTSPHSIHKRLAEAM
ncbi:hypothetical protein GIB67_032426 [Kingdonia uniflora]|uniref:CDT1 Geminin-binding domain-containing protein n=1 Tax=Kingdonia uniflora TaxID=39325 RepID=A0A7J7MJ58_9MAGN|nr:hypothetical protein GIB67_032426 [Kingdonia uniflora]